MTDVVKLTARLYDRIEWQNVPEDVTREDLVDIVMDAIRYLYVVTGRALIFREDMFACDNGTVTFSKDLPQDEQEYVLLTAEINFYKKVQTNVSDLVSYTTDAMSVAHGDKPFANIQQKLTDLRSERTVIWYKMTRYHLL